MKYEIKVLSLQYKSNNKIIMNKDLVSYEFYAGAWGDYDDCVLYGIEYVLDNLI